MTRSIARTVAGLAIVALPMFAVEAQVCVGAPSCSVNPTVSLTIPKVVRLAVTGVPIVLTTPNFATDSLDGQLVTTSFAGVSIRANHAWTVNVSAAATDWTYTGTEGGVRAAGLLEYQPNCGGGYSAISATPTMALSGALTNSASPNLCLRTVFPADYSSLANRPGVYTLVVTLTLAAN